MAGQCLGLNLFYIKPIHAEFYRPSLALAVNPLLAPPDYILDEQLSTAYAD